MEPFKLEADRQRGTFRLVGELDVASVELVQSQLEKELGRSGTLTLDASDLKFMDSQGLHMLIHLGEQAEKRGETIRLVHCSQAVRRLLNVAVPHGVPGVEIVEVT
jgi:anti-anti-sigma factor